jgi:hypothetical protein
MTGMEVLDSAVKIGLGALIGAVAGWLTLRSSQTHELQRELFRRRLRIIDEIIDVVHQTVFISMRLGVLARKLLKMDVSEAPVWMVDQGLEATEKFANHMPDIIRSVVLARSIGLDEVADNLEQVYRQVGKVVPGMEAVEVTDLQDQDPEGYGELERLCKELTAKLNAEAKKLRG